MTANSSENLAPNIHTRVGLFGGTFNPVHIGHLRCMVEVKNALLLDQLIVIPCNEPPHKKTDDIVDAGDRTFMIQQALSGVEGICISDVEILRSGPSYTIDTVKYFIEQIHNPKELFLIMGLDAFLEIETWRAYKDFFKHLSIVVMKRPDNSSQENGLSEKRVETFLKSKVSADYEFFASESVFLHPLWNRVYVVNVTPLYISSTQIRSIVKNGGEITFLVPKEVETFINEKGLYK